MNSHLRWTLPAALVLFLTGIGCASHAPSLYQGGRTLGKGNSMFTIGLSFPPNYLADDLTEGLVAEPDLEVQTMEGDVLGDTVIGYGLAPGLDLHVRPYNPLWIETFGIECGVKKSLIETKAFALAILPVAGVWVWNERKDTGDPAAFIEGRDQAMSMQEWHLGLHLPMGWDATEWLLVYGAPMVRWMEGRLVKYGPDDVTLERSDLWLGAMLGLRFELTPQYFLAAEATALGPMESNDVDPMRVYVIPAFAFGTLF